MEIVRIAVLGAGQMGAGIAQVASCAGFQVMMIDIEQEYIDRGIKNIEKSLLKLVSKHKMSQEEANIAMSLVSTSTSREAAADADLVIEAIPEVIGLKTSACKDLDKICKETAILATNTSSISINELAASTRRPARVIGMHFMNPVPIMKLIEVINGRDTLPEVTDAVLQLSEKLGKIPLQCNDSPGFISNRILCPMLNEAILALQEGVATPEAIDGIMKLGMNHPIGPLALADLIGLDTVLHIMNVLREGLEDEKYAPAELLVSMVSEGRLGRKTGAGFYSY